jgi:Protein of unknown function (DUF4238)
MDKKNQHVIPNSYLQAWRDPNTPKGQEPYVWVHPKLGGEPKRKSPKNKWFTEVDRYTIKSPTGERNLEIEDTLGSLENHLAALRERLQAGEPYSTREHMLMCAFTAAMCSRTKPAGDNWSEFHVQIREQVRKQAAEHGHVLRSESLDDAVRNAHPQFVEATLQTLTPMLFRMHAGIHIPVGHDGTFITSDNPCVWNDPDAYRRPPGQRDPALMYENIEITLPLGPRVMLMFTHKHEYGGFFKADRKCVDIVNSRTRFRASDWFVTHDGRNEDIWFEERPLPDDAWENTTEGQEALKEAARFKKAARRLGTLTS